MQPLRRSAEIALWMMMAGIIWPSGSKAKEIPRYLVSGKSYHAARSALLREGWRPRLTHGDKGAVGDLVQAQWAEVENCSGTGLGLCNFNWQRKGRCLSVVTAGDFAPAMDLPKIDRVHFAKCKEISRR